MRVLHPVNGTHAATSEARHQAEGEAEQPVSSALPDFLAQTSTLPARDELLPGLIARGETTGLHGAPRTLKTWAVLEIAVALTTGTPAFGMQMPRTRARVLYLTNEDSLHRSRRASADS